MILLSRITKKFLSIIIFSIIIIFAFEITAKDKISKNKKAIINSLEIKRDRLIEISDNIWEAAEPALLEFKSSKYLWDYAEENGFKVTKGVADIPTAFTAEYGSGKPIIGILGEFDDSMTDTSYTRVGSWGRYLKHFLPQRF